MRAAPFKPRWYVADRHGALTLCLDEADARKEARMRDRWFAAGAPHVAIRLGRARQRGRKAS